MKISKPAIVLYSLSALLALTVLIGIFTFIPKEVVMGLTEKSAVRPSLFLFLLSLLPLFSTWVCLGAKEYKALAILLFSLLTFLTVSIILRQFGILMPVPAICTILLSLAALAAGIKLLSIKKKEKFSIQLKWIESEDEYLRIQKEAGTIFISYSALQAILLIFSRFGILSFNLAILVPVLAFVLAITVMMKRSLKK
jgi:hypothetical protein